METPVYDLAAIDKVIRERRAVYPKMYNDQPVTDEEIMHLLENANWAPTHKKTEPWRFRVLRGNALKRLGEFLAGNYVRRTPPELYSDRKFNSMLEKPLRSSAVIAIYMKRDEADRLPEWEELAAVSAAVQNMWLTATAMGIATYWSTPRAFINAEDFVQLEEGERCLGMLYLGKWDYVPVEGKRTPVETKVQWITE